MFVEGGIVRKSIMMASLSILLAASKAGAADHMTGQGLLDLCKSHSPEGIGACKGYILATADTTSLVIGLDPSIRAHVSPADPEIFSSGDVVGTVVKFLEDRSNEKSKDGQPVLSLGATGFIWAALRMNHPSTPK